MAFKPKCHTGLADCKSANPDRFAWPLQRIGPLYTNRIVGDVEALVGLAGVHGRHGQRLELLTSNLGRSRGSVRGHFE